MGECARVTDIWVDRYDGGKLKALAQQELHVKLDDMGMVESLHLLLFHYVLARFHRRVLAP